MNGVHQKNRWMKMDILRSMKHINPGVRNILVSSQIVEFSPAIFPSGALLFFGYVGLPWASVMLSKRFPCLPVNWRLVFLRVLLCLVWKTKPWSFGGFSLEGSQQNSRKGRTGCSCGVCFLLNFASLCLVPFETQDYYSRKDVFFRWAKLLNLRASLR